MLEIDAGSGPVSDTEHAMTIDMLAATFFWPEGTLLGAQGLPPHDGLPPQQGLSQARDPSRAATAADEAAVAEGFWATVARNLWRPAGAPSTGAVG
jgi:hypothetical protein